MIERGNKMRTARLIFCKGKNVNIPLVSIKGIITGVKINKEKDGAGLKPLEPSSAISEATWSEGLSTGRGIHTNPYATLDKGGHLMTWSRGRYEQ